MIADLYSGLVLVAVTAWQRLVQLGPYVVGGVVLAALLGQLDLRRLSEISFRGRTWSGRGGLFSILGATCLGSVSPLSTYGTMPVLLQLLRQGASPGPVLAFLVASSMLNPQLFFLVLGGLGARLALAQLVGIFILSLAVGMAASRFHPSLFLRTVAISTDPLPSRAPPSLARLGSDLIKLIEWIGLTFVVGVVLAAALEVWAPPNWMASLTSANRWIVVPLAGALGIPLYTCGGSAVPVLAELAQMGLSRAAVLAFLLAGPATRVTALAAMGNLLNRRALAAYAAYIVVGASVIGLLLG